MTSLISLIIWSVVSYFIVKQFNEKYEGLNANPWLYALGTIIFSFALTMSWLAYNICSLTNNVKGKNLSVVMFIISLIFNLYVLFA